MREATFQPPAQPPAQPTIALFREVQRFTQPWLWIVLLAPAAFAWWAVIQQIGLGVPFGNNPGSDMLVIILWLAMGIAMPGLMASLRLNTEVREDGIYARFVPFHLRWRRFAFSDLKTIEARKYSPIMDYGGWGIRWSFAGTAYNVKGNMGIQLVLNNGKRVLIGTQQPDAFMAAIAHAHNEAAKRRH